MNEPFVVAVGMVLQRNWKRDEGESTWSPFNDLCGRYFRVIAVSESFGESFVSAVEATPEPYPLGWLLSRDRITAEWFIPD